MQQFSNKSGLEITALVLEMDLLFLEKCFGYGFNSLENFYVVRELSSFFSKGEAPIELVEIKFIFSTEHELLEVIRSSTFVGQLIL